MEAGGYSKTTAINHIKKLESQNAIEVTRSPLYFDTHEKPRNLPNKYKLNFNIMEHEKDESVIKTIKSIGHYDVIAKDVISDLFTNLEWAHLYYNPFALSTYCNH